MKQIGCYAFYGNTIKKKWSIGLAIYNVNDTDGDGSGSRPLATARRTVYQAPVLADPGQARGTAVALRDGIGSNQTETASETKQ
jgi:hypothetical protein